VRLFLGNCSQSFQIALFFIGSHRSIELATNSDRDCLFRWSPGVARFPRGGAPGFFFVGFSRSDRAEGGLQRSVRAPKDGGGLASSATTRARPECFARIEPCHWVVRLLLGQPICIATEQPRASHTCHRGWDRWQDRVRAEKCQIRSPRRDQLLLRRGRLAIVGRPITSRGSLARHAEPQTSSVVERVLP
jgi:hypothetical protein